MNKERESMKVAKTTTTKTTTLKRTTPLTINQVNIITTYKILKEIQSSLPLEMRPTSTVTTIDIDN
jgi:hypothetical protein